MKKLEFILDRFQADQICSPIRTKIDVISLWMNTIKMMLAYVPVPQELVGGTMALVVSKMSRIFFVLEDKVFSLNFPFFVNYDGGELTFSTLSCQLVDNKVTSEILSLLHTNGVLTSVDVASFADPIIDSCVIDSGIWELLRDLMICEEGYIRYDHDPELQNGDIHPLHHLDVFYSTASTFKIGCRKRFSLPDFTDMLDIRTNCHYIVPVR